MKRKKLENHLKENRPLIKLGSLENKKIDIHLSYTYEELKKELKRDYPELTLGEMEEIWKRYMFPHESIIKTACSELFREIVGQCVHDASTAASKISTQKGQKEFSLESKTYSERYRR